MTCGLRLLILLALFGFPLKAQYTIEGRIQLDSEWDSVVYLSAINSFDHFNMASLEFLVNSAPIDATGQFTISGDNLPGEDRIYRLHFVKKDDPVNSIIIGGRDENHIHFIMNNSSYLRIVQDREFPRIPSLNISGHPANAEWKKLENRILTKYDSKFPVSSVEKTYNRKAKFRKLYQYSDTCQSPILSLLAIRSILKDPDALTKQDIVRLQDNVILVGRDYESPYTDELGKQLEFVRFIQSDISSNRSNSNHLILLAVAFLGILMIVFFGYPLWKRKHNEIRKSRRLENLSLREMRVFELMISGKSNKEISRDLNIGLNTVKTHVSNIYSKLRISSRKGLLKYTVSQGQLTSEAQ